MQADTGYAEAAVVPFKNVAKAHPGANHGSADDPIEDTGDSGRQGYDDDAGQEAELQPGGEEAQVEAGKEGAFQEEGGLVHGMVPQMWMLHGSDPSHLSPVCGQPVRLTPYPCSEDVLIEIL